MRIYDLKTTALIFTSGNMVDTGAIGFGQLEIIFSLNLIVLKKTVFLI